MKTINHILNNPVQSAVTVAILRLDTDRMLSESDVTSPKLFVLPGYNNVNRWHPNKYFRNKSVFTNFTS